METLTCGANGARTLYAPTGYDRGYWTAVRASRILSRLSSRVVLPEVIEVPVDRPLLVAANHSSLFDLGASLITLGHFGINARVGVNSRFFGNPIGGAVLRSIGAIPFSREDREVAEATMIGALEGGQACAIMPEGRITRPEDQVAAVGLARPGVSRIARRAGAAVLPVGFAGADEAWKPGTPFPRLRFGRHSVHVHVGSPIVFESDDHEANATLLMKAIGSLVLEGRELTE